MRLFPTVFSGGVHTPPTHRQNGIDASVSYESFICTTYTLLLYNINIAYARATRNDAMKHLILRFIVLAR